jgi:nitrate/TMAO reductase-like tetraheme cytochrome c subunit
LILVVAVGLALGVGAYTFVYARGASYLTNDPAAGADCHVMREQYDGWIAGSHRAKEAARILAESIDFTRQGQLALREPRPR